MQIFPKVSIIILNWNGLRDTAECLESLKKITYHNYKVIVVDNGSKNNEANILNNKFNEYIHLIQNKKNLGFAGGNNIGIKYALHDSADYILLLNNDTVVEPNFLEELVKIVEKNDRIGIIGAITLFYHFPSRIAFGGGKINYLKGEAHHLYNNQSDNTIPALLYNVDFVEGSAMLIKKCVFKKIGLLDENFFSYWEDVDFCLRANKNKFSVMMTPNSRVYHKISQSTGGDFSPKSIYYLSRNRILFVKKHCNSLQRFIFNIFLFFDSLRLIKVYRNHQRIKFYLKGLLDGFRYKSI